MAEYYVVRDKNTGLYFRGKGVNRWGKYYNQASIYRIRANAENTIKEVSWRGEQAEVVPIQIVETTADAVEVVRCKDCKHNADNGEDCDRVLIHTHRNLITETNEYQYFKLNYCEYGTPKERGGEK
jgi:hypothetical protein